MSYTDNGNGTITDNVTGLMWQKGDTPETNWYQASGTYDATNNPTSQSICGSLTLGGQSDWRLPTKRELLSIVDYTIVDYSIHHGATINTTYFLNTNLGSYNGYYWSSTASAGSTDYAWYVRYYDASFNSEYMLASFSVRCVRGGQSSPSFTDNGNGTVTDNGTGLMWQQGGSGSMARGSALPYCEGLSLGGQTDWRLPNSKELESITDATKYNPAIDTTYFPNTNVSNYLLEANALIKLKECEDKIFEFEASYGMDFKGFSNAWKQNNVQNKHSHKMESTFMEWEGFESERKKWLQFLHDMRLSG